MNLRLVSGLLFLASALVFLGVGLARVPRDTVSILLGVTFAVFAVIRLRGARRP